MILKIIFFVFLVPIVISLGTMFARLISMVLMMIAVGIGGTVHHIFAGKKEHKWTAPEYISLVQLLIIQGFVYAVVANILGSALNWHLLLSIGSGLDKVFGLLLLVDLLVLIILATRHGYFE